MYFPFLNPLNRNMFPELTQLMQVFYFFCQALAGEVGMSNELDDVSRALYNGQIPNIWRKLAPETLKSLGNWMLHFQKRYQQYNSWVSNIFHFNCKMLSHTNLTCDMHIFSKRERIDVTSSTTVDQYLILCVLSLFEIVLHI